MLNIKTIKRSIRDDYVMWLIRQVLSQYYTKEGKGMPLGNLTSQFFANLYLNDLDYFVKHKLKAKYYIRYVDDFIILHNSQETLQIYKDKINGYLNNLKLELHPNKSRIIPIYKGINILGFRIFYYHKLLKKNNFKRFKRNLNIKINHFLDQNSTYDKFMLSLQGWFGYAMWANTYKFKNIIMNRLSEFTK